MTTTKISYTPRHSRHDQCAQSTENAQGEAPAALPTQVSQPTQVGSPVQAALPTQARLPALAPSAQIYTTQQTRQSASAQQERQGTAQICTVQQERQGTAQICTAQQMHQGTRAYQQDALYVSDPKTRPNGAGQPEAFAVLCDGMGGTAQGAEASSLVVSQMAVALDGLGPADNPSEWLYELVHYLDLQVCEQFGYEQAGTTVVAVYLQGAELSWVSVGDSRIYLINGNSIECLTRDHNLQLALDNEVAQGTLTPEEVQQFERRDSLISFLGQGHLPLVDHSPPVVTLSAGSVVLLCSDGLTKSLSEHQILDIIRAEQGTLDKAARRLVQEAFDTGGEKDNTTVALLQYLQGPGEVAGQQGLGQQGTTGQGGTQQGEVVTQQDLAPQKPTSQKLTQQKLTQQKRTQQKLTQQKRAQKRQSQQKTITQDKAKTRKETSCS